MNSIIALALNTFRETVRDRVLYAFIVFAIILTLTGILLGSLSVGQSVRVLEDIGMFTISTIGGIIAIFVGTNLVFKELDKRTIYLILTKPIRRWQFILGKFLGLSLCILIITILMGAFLIGLLLFNGATMQSMPGLLLALGTIFLELLLVIALATFFSTFATPLMSVIFTIGFWLAGHLGQSLLSLSKMSQSDGVRILFQGIYYALPDLSKLAELRFEMVTPPSPGAWSPDVIVAHFGTETLLLLTAYVLAYVVLLLSFGTLIIERREFN
jgi:ABC-type transport system involved in multi-copper enzyme maturation permease subunit